MAKKADSTLLKEARARIEELEKDLERQKGYTKMYQDKAEKLELQINSVHEALDTVGVPRYFKKDEYCSRDTMELAARLFAWQMGARVKPEDA
jgi:septal ring factor EnvC (AmiA/AmiB activator)